jgi:hypothetical protein
VVPARSYGDSLPVPVLPEELGEGVHLALITASGYFPVALNLFMADEEWVTVGLV